MSFRLGLTGGIATGKSTVSQHLSQLGFPVIDADVGARVVVEPGEPGIEAIEREFGKEYLFPNGTLNRKKLAQLIFEDERARKQLDFILQDPIKQWIQQKLNQYEQEKHALIVLDIPLLFEQHYDVMCDEIMVVYTPEIIQLERLKQRDRLTEKEAKERMMSQMSIEQKQNLADILIDNSHSIDSTLQQVDAWLAINGFMV